MKKTERIFAATVRPKTQTTECQQIVNLWQCCCDVALAVDILQTSGTWRFYSVTQKWRHFETEIYAGGKIRSLTYFNVW